MHWLVSRLDGGRHDDPQLILVLGCLGPWGCAASTCSLQPSCHCRGGARCDWLSRRRLAPLGEACFGQGEIALTKPTKKVDASQKDLCFVHDLGEAKMAAAIKCAANLEASAAEATALAALPARFRSARSRRHRASPLTSLLLVTAALKASHSFCRLCHSAKRYVSCELQ